MCSSRALQSSSVHTFVIHRRSLSMEKSCRRSWKEIPPPCGFFLAPFLSLAAFISCSRLSSSLLSAVQKLPAEAHGARSPGCLAQLLCSPSSSPCSPAEPPSRSFTAGALAPCPLHARSVCSNSVYRADLSLPCSRSVSSSSPWPPHLFPLAASSRPTLSSQLLRVSLFSAQPRRSLSSPRRRLAARPARSARPWSCPASLLAGRILCVASSVQLAELSLSVSHGRASPPDSAHPGHQLCSPDP
jgi:hypothetical protein